MAYNGTYSDEIKKELERQRNEELARLKEEREEERRARRESMNAMTAEDMQARAENLDRASKIAYGAGVVTAGMSGYADQKLLNDLNDKNIDISGNLARTGSYGNVQERVMDYNNHDKEVAAVNSVNSMGENLKMLGGYGAIAGTAVQLANNVLSASGVTGNIIGRMNESERTAAENQARMAEGILGEGEDMTMASNNGLGEAMQSSNLRGKRHNIAVGEDGMEIDKPEGHSDPTSSVSDSSYNVIPSGALHEEPNHLGAVDHSFAGLTRMGIPVVSESDESSEGNIMDDGKRIVQHAEIERGEIILRKALTDELLALRNSGTRNDMIEAGRILVDEVLNNTRDNIGLIKSLKGYGQV